MRRIALVTTSRSEWGIQRPIVAALQDRDDVELSIVAGGMHLSTAFGLTVADIQADGFGVAAGLSYLAPGDTPFDIAQSISQGVTAFARCFAGARPDIVTVLGDRFDMFPAVIAALPLSIPVAHIHGGERTEGSIDESIRHAITKLSHIHFTSTCEYANRVIQMGELPENVHCVGAPGLDDIASHTPIDTETLRETYGFQLGHTNVLVVYHPETRTTADQTPAESMATLLDAVKCSMDNNANFVIVSPNADSGHIGIDQTIQSFCEHHPRARQFQSIPRQAFLTLMDTATLMIGNSSAGIIEAPSFKTPAVNVGTRQDGRVRAANVIDTEPEYAAICDAIQHAQSAKFAATLNDLVNPYGDGQSAKRIAEILATTPITPQLLAKRFYDQPDCSPQSLANSTSTRTADSISSRHAHSFGE